MDHNPPSIYANAQGLWEQNAPGEKRLWDAWAEITAVSGACYEAGDRVLTCVTFGLSWGEFCEVFTDWPCFDALARSLPEYLAGLPADWLTRITELTPGLDTEVWHQKSQD